MEAAKNKVNLLDHHIIVKDKFEKELKNWETPLQVTSTEC